MPTTINRAHSLLAKLSQESPDAIVLSGADIRYTAVELAAAVQSTAAQLNSAGVKRLALLADNSPDWVIMDLACEVAGVCIIPLPLFFSTQQLRSGIDRSGADALVTDDGKYTGLLAGQNLIAGPEKIATGLSLYHLEKRDQSRLPMGTAKITFTSGSTGNPKGVCLSVEQQWAVAQALHAVIDVPLPRHLCLLPLSTLLENIGGVYLPLLLGAEVVALSAEKRGLQGSSGLDAMQLADTLTSVQPSSLILVPQLLTALLKLVADDWQAPSSLRFIAVGGAKVDPTLLDRARKKGLPVYEGYGLSENSSVACLNLPGAERSGSVGKALPSADLAIRDGEVVIRGSTFLGYLGEPESWYQAELQTGDLGRVDSDGYIYIEGRKKNLLISSFGRNISPEWIEARLLSNGLIAQCIVLGDAQPYCSALILPEDQRITDSDIQAWVEVINAELPDYARVLAWHRLTQSLEQCDGLYTANGRPRRDRIAKGFSRFINSLYPDESRVH